MTRLQLAQEQTERLLDRLLRVFDKALLKVPPEQLDFRPTPENMSAREMAHHTYRVVLAAHRGVELGRLEREDMDFLSFDAEAARHAEDLVDWGDRVKDHARRVAAQLSEEQLQRPVRYYYGVTATGWEALRNANEEVLHHRGQMMIYLRLMGIKPPGLGA